MLGYAARRLLFALVVIWVAASLSFLLVRLAPSDPATVLLGSTATAEELFAERERMGLNDPLLVQYANFITGLVQLDLGQSMMRGGSAMDLVLSRLPNSLLLAGLSTLVAIPVQPFTTRAPDCRCSMAMDSRPNAAMRPRLSQ